MNSRIETLIKRARKKERKAYENYQQTGLTRYHSAYRREDEIATIFEGYQRAEEYIHTAHRLEAAILGWGQTIEDMQYYTRERAEAEKERIIQEITGEAGLIRLKRA